MKTVIIAMLLAAAASIGTAQANCGGDHGHGDGHHKGHGHGEWEGRHDGHHGDGHAEAWKHGKDGHHGHDSWQGHCGGHRDGGWHHGYDGHWDRHWREHFHGGVAYIGEPFWLVDARTGPGELNEAIWHVAKPDGYVVEEVAQDYVYEAPMGAGAARLNPQTVDLDSFKVSYLGGTVGGGVEQLFSDMVTAAMPQGLIGETTRVWSIYPDAMVKGYGPETTVYAALSLPAGISPAAPMQVYEAPGGRYLKAQHWGDYSGLPQTYEALFAWAGANEVPVSTGPILEQYVTDPSDTLPVDQWLTEIYLPLD